MAQITLGLLSTVGYKLTGEDGNEVAVQTDYDYPGVAGSFGWSICDSQVMNRGYYGLRPCDHSGTDGTITCDDCGLTPTTFINAARDYLDSHIGDTVEDPGYL